MPISAVATPRPGRAARLVGPGLATLLMLAALIGLGVWQLHRLAWKEAILTAIARGESGPALPLTADPPAFAKVSASGTFPAGLTALYGDEVRDTAAGPVMGAQLLMPLQRPGAPPVLVDRGWVPLSRPAPVEQPAGTVTVQGYVRAPDHPGWLSAADTPAARRFFTLDPAAVGRSLGLAAVAPFTLVALGAPPPGGFPVPAEHLPQPPNNHLSYAITWFSFAAILATIFVLWARKALRDA